MRLNKQFVKLLKSLEETKKTGYPNCFTCMYKYKELGHCWYTMTTNKKNVFDCGMCSHYVDIDKVEKIWNNKNSI